MLNTDRFTIHSGGAPLFGSLQTISASCHSFPRIPVFAETLLSLELLSQGPSADLHEISQAVLRDPGATLQIFRLAAQEYESPGDYPQRIEDCISAIGMQACQEALSRQPILHPLMHRTVLELWFHSQEVAHVCRSVVEEMASNICPGDAYLVGLCHGLGAMPARLGWKQSHGTKGDDGLRIAKRWCLPKCVQEYFCTSEPYQSEIPWVEILRIAHQSVAQFPACHLCEPKEPRLKWGSLDH